MNAALGHTDDSGPSRLPSHLSRFLITVWAGSLWTICGVVAPSLFAVLDDRRLAGDLAGQFFRIEAWLGLGCGALLALLLGVCRTGSPSVYRWISVTALLPVLSELGLRPLMASARAAGDMMLFGLLHTAAAVLFLGACIGALVLVLKLKAPAG